MKNAESPLPSPAPETARRGRAATWRLWMSALCAGLLAACRTAGTDWTTLDLTAWRSFSD